MSDTLFLRGLVRVQLHLSNRNHCPISPMAWATVAASPSRRAESLGENGGGRLGDI
jgi:hypothetical protein